MFLSELIHRQYAASVFFRRKRWILKIWRYLFEECSSCVEISEKWISQIGSGFFQLSQKSIKD